MSYWDKNPQNYRAIIIIIGLAMFLASFFNFYKVFTTPTDENLYTDIGDKFYFTKKIPADELNVKNRKVVSRKKSFIDKGEILLQVGKEPVNSDSILTNQLEKMQDTLRFVTLSPGSVSPRSINHRILEVMPEDFSREQLEFFDNGVIIVHMTEEGASERAGLKTGDIILKIDGQKFSGAIDADNLMKSYSIGDVIEYEVLSGGDIKSRSVKLSKYGTQVSVILIYLFGTLMFLLGIYLGASRPRLIAARIIGLSLASFGFAFAMSINVSIPGVSLFSVLRLLLQISAIHFGLSFLLHGLFYFPRENPLMINKHWVPLVSYLSSVFWIWSSTLIIIFSEKTFFGINKYAFVSYAGMAIIFWLLIYTLFIRIRYRKLYSAQYKRDVRFIRYAGIFLTIVFALVQVVVITSQMTAIVNLLPLGIIIFLLAFVYTIARYKLLDFDIRVKRNIQFEVLLLAVNVLFITGLIASIISIARLNLNIPVIELTGDIFANPAISISGADEYNQSPRIINTAIAILLSLASVWILYTLRKNLLIYLNRKFDRITFDFHKTSSQLFEMLEKSLTRNELARGIAEKLGELLKLKIVGVLVLENKMKFSHMEYFNFNDEDFCKFNHSVSIKLIQTVSRFNRAMMADYLPNGIKQRFFEHGFQYIIPVKSKGKLLAVFLIGGKKSESNFKGEELELLTTIASQASVAFENALLYEDLSQKERMKHELEIARRIQLATLPYETPDLRGLMISGVSLPAYEVGGDFYDYIMGDNGDFSVVAGDVSGKGTSAALYMTKIQGIIRTLSEFELSPAELLRRANNQMYGQIERSSFISAILLKFIKGTDSVTVSRAGHLPLYYYNSAHNSVERILPAGMALGISPENIFNPAIEEINLKYHEGDIFLLISDGISEAMSPSKQEFGEDRVIKCLNNFRNLPPAEIRDKLLREVKMHSGDMPQHDDLTAVVIKTGSAEAVADSE